MSRTPYTPYCFVSISLLKSVQRFFVLGAFLLNSFCIVPVQAQEFVLPKPGVMVRLSPPMDPPILKGIKVHPDNPFKFDFILDKGDSSLSNEELKDESNKLIKYFLASLTIPERDLWVNLSPYEKDRIIPISFGVTEMGRDLLAEDYLLKQITASLIYPEDEVGKKFWKRIYEEAQKKYGTTNIPVNTFNKVWIVPDKAVIYENAKVGAAYVSESKLKVMLEEDYLSLEKHATATATSDTHSLGSQIVREIVIPELTKEINEGKNFAKLRQVYNSLILAAWYKKKIKDSILSQVYADKSKTQGVNIDDPQEKEKIYKQYLQAFKKGVYNYIKEDPDPVTGEKIPRKYFSGGVAFAMSVPGATNLHANSAMDIRDASKLSRRGFLGTVGDLAHLISISAVASALGVGTETQAAPKKTPSSPQLAIHYTNIRMENLKAWASGEKITKDGRRMSVNVNLKNDADWAIYMTGKFDQRAGDTIKSPSAVTINVHTPDLNNPPLGIVWHELVHVSHNVMDDDVMLLDHLLRFKKALLAEGNQKAITAFQGILKFFYTRYSSESAIWSRLQENDKYPISPEEAQKQLDALHHPPVVSNNSSDLDKGEGVEQLRILNEEERLKELKIKNLLDQVMEVKGVTPLSDEQLRRQIRKTDEDIRNGKFTLVPVKEYDLRKMTRLEIDKLAKERIKWTKNSCRNVASEFFAYLSQNMIDNLGVYPFSKGMDPTRHEMYENLRILVSSLGPRTALVLAQHLSAFDFLVPIKLRGIIEGTAVTQPASRAMNIQLVNPVMNRRSFVFATAAAVAATSPLLRTFQAMAQGVVSRSKTSAEIKAEVFEKLHSDGIVVKSFNGNADAWEQAFSDEGTRSNFTIGETTFQTRFTGELNSAINFFGNKEMIDLEVLFHEMTHAYQSHGRTDNVDLLFALYGMKQALLEDADNDPDNKDALDIFHRLIDLLQKNYSISAIIEEFLAGRITPQEAQEQYEIIIQANEKKKWHSEPRLETGKEEKDILRSLRAKDAFLIAIDPKRNKQKIKEEKDYEDQIGKSLSDRFGLMQILPKLNFNEMTKEKIREVQKDFFPSDENVADELFAWLIGKLSGEPNSEVKFPRIKQRTEGMKEVDRLAQRLADILLTRLPKTRVFIVGHIKKNGIYMPPKLEENASRAMNSEPVSIPQSAQYIDSGSQGEIYAYPGEVDPENPKRVIKIFNSMPGEAEIRAFKEVYDFLMEDPSIRESLLPMQFVPVDFKGRSTWGIVMDFIPKEKQSLGVVLNKHEIDGTLTEKGGRLKLKAFDILNRIDQLTEERFGYPLADRRRSVTHNTEDFANFKVMDEEQEKLINFDPINYEILKKIIEKRTSGGLASVLRYYLERLVLNEADFLELANHRMVDIYKLFKNEISKDISKYLDRQLAENPTADQLFDRWALKQLEDGHMEITTNVAQSWRAKALTMVWSAVGVEKSYSITMQVLDQAGAKQRFDVNLNADDIRELKGYAQIDERSLVHFLVNKIKKARDSLFRHSEVNMTALKRTLNRILGSSAMISQQQGQKASRAMMTAVGDRASDVLDHVYTILGAPALPNAAKRFGDEELSWGNLTRYDVFLKFKSQRETLKIGAQARIDSLNPIEGQDEEKGFKTYTFDLPEDLRVDELFALNEKLRTLGLDKKDDQDVDSKKMAENFKKMAYLIALRNQTNPQTQWEDLARAYYGIGLAFEKGRTEGIEIPMISEITQEASVRFTEGTERTNLENDIKDWLGPEAASLDDTEALTKIMTQKAILGAGIELDNLLYRRSTRAFQEVFSANKVPKKKSLRTLLELFFPGLGRIDLEDLAKKINRANGPIEKSKAQYEAIEAIATQIIRLGGWNKGQRSNVTKESFSGWALQTGELNCVGRSTLLAHYIDVLKELTGGGIKVYPLERNLSARSVENRQHVILLVELTNGTYYLLESTADNIKDVITQIKNPIAENDIHSQELAGRMINITSIGGQTTSEVTARVVGLQGANGFASAFYINLAKDMLDRKDYGAAQEYLLKAVEIDQKTVNAGSVLGDLYNQLGNPARAIYYFEKGAKFNPDDHAALMGTARLCVLVGDYEKASKYFRLAIVALKKAMKLDYEDFGVMHRHLGELYADLADVEEKRRVSQELISSYYQTAKDEYLRAIKLDEDDFKAHYGLGKLYQKRKQYETAAESFENALSIKRSNGEVQYQAASNMLDWAHDLDLAGDAREARKKYRQAVKYFDKLQEDTQMQKDENFYDAYGRALLEAQIYAQAVEEFDKEIILLHRRISTVGLRDPGFVRNIDEIVIRTLFLKARALWEMGDKKAAAEVYQRIIEDGKDHKDYQEYTEVHMKLIEYYAQTENYDKEYKVITSLEISIEIALAFKGDGNGGVLSNKFDREAMQYRKDLVERLEKIKLKTRVDSRLGDYNFNILEGRSLDSFDLTKKKDCHDLDAQIRSVLLTRDIYLQQQIQESAAMKTNNSTKSDAAMKKGGIDFNADKLNLQIQNAGGGIKFNVDPAMLQQLKNAPGFVPVIINIQPLQSLPLFLGLKDEETAVQSG